MKLKAFSFLSSVKHKNIVSLSSKFSSLSIINSLHKTKNPQSVKTGD